MVERCLGFQFGSQHVLVQSICGGCHVGLFKCKVCAKILYTHTHICVRIDSSGNTCVFRAHANLISVIYAITLFSRSR